MTRRVLLRSAAPRARLFYSYKSRIKSDVVKQGRFHMLVRYGLLNADNNVLPLIHI